MSRSDKDGDGKISAEEMKSIDSRWRSSVEKADSDGDGSVTREELTASMKKRMGN